MEITEFKINSIPVECKLFNDSNAIAKFNREPKYFEELYLSHLDPKTEIKVVYLGFFRNFMQFEADAIVKIVGSINCYPYKAIRRTLSFIENIYDEKITDLQFYGPRKEIGPLIIWANKKYIAIISPIGVENDTSS